MTNLFDTTNFPTVVPSTLYQGNRWMWKRDDLTDYGSGYSLNYYLTPEGGGAPISLSASLSGGEYIVDVGASTTTTYNTGVYYWTATITRDSDSERIQESAGTITVKPNPSSSTADPRSDSRKVLDAIEAVIAQRATQDQMSYTINGRSLERTPIRDLLYLRDTYRREVQAEEKAERIAKGLGSGSQIKVRLR